MWKQRHWVIPCSRNCRKSIILYSISMVVMKFGIWAQQVSTLEYKNVDILIGYKKKFQVQEEISVKRKYIWKTVQVV